MKPHFWTHCKVCQMLLIPVLFVCAIQLFSWLVFITQVYVTLNYLYLSVIYIYWLIGNYLGWLTFCLIENYLTADLQRVFFQFLDHYNSFSQVFNKVINSFGDKVCPCLTLLSKLIFFVAEWRVIMGVVFLYMFSMQLEYQWSIQHSLEI